MKYYFSSHGGSNSASSSYGSPPAPQPSAPISDYGQAAAPACRTVTDNVCTSRKVPDCRTVQDNVSRQSLEIILR